MTRRNRLKSGMLGLLGTFTSRYTEYQGYWLFGHLTQLESKMGVDLLQSPALKAKGSPFETAEYLAIVKFKEQLAKANLDVGQLTSAVLSIEKGKAATDLISGKGEDIPGHNFHVQISATLRDCRPLSFQTSIFVAHFSLFSCGAKDVQVKRKWWKLF